MMTTSEDNRRTKGGMLASFRAWSRANGSATPHAMNAAAAAGLCLEAHGGDTALALEMAATMPREDGQWVDAVRYLTHLLADELSETHPPARLTVVR